MIKIFNNLFENTQYYTTIAKIHQSDQLSVMDAYRINRLVKNVNELTTEYSELKRTLLEKYGDPGEEEGTYVIKKEAKLSEEFMREMKSLLMIEHELESDKLSFPKKIKDGFSAADMNILEIFFDLDELEDKTGHEKEKSDIVIADADVILE